MFHNYSLEITIDMPDSVLNILEVLDKKLVLSLRNELKLFDLKTRKIIKELKDISS